jgi:Tfp pilus assembly protein PilN
MGAITSSILAALIVGGLHVRQVALEDSLVAREDKAKQDSARFGAVLREKHKAEAQRDSVLAQLAIIKQIDNDRFVWPHIMDEVSRALPPYTWLTSLAFTTPAPSAAAAPAGGDTKDKKAAKAAADSVLATPIKFKIVGNTVDIQALTRFMRLLESSPFVQNVQLARSTLILADGKEVTEFQLDAEYQRPDSTAVRRVPIALSVR